MFMFRIALVSQSFEALSVTWYRSLQLYEYHYVCGLEYIFQFTSLYAKYSAIKVILDRTGT